MKCNELDDVMLKNRVIQNCCAKHFLITRITSSGGRQPIQHLGELVIDTDFDGFNAHGNETQFTHLLAPTEN